MDNNHSISNLRSIFILGDLPFKIEDPLIGNFKEANIHIIVYDSSEQDETIIEWIKNNSKNIIVVVENNIYRRDIHPYLPIQLCVSLKNKKKVEDLKELLSKPWVSIPITEKKKQNIANSKKRTDLRSAISDRKITETVEKISVLRNEVSKLEENKEKIIRDGEKYRIEQEYKIKLKLKQDEEIMKQKHFEKELKLQRDEQIMERKQKYLELKFEQKQSQLELKLEHDTEIMRQKKLKQDELEMKLEQSLIEVKHTYENITKIDSDTVCVICMNAPISTLMAPCGHLNFCYECAIQMISKPCPICRKKVTHVMKTYT